MMTFRQEVSYLETNNDIPVIRREAQQAQVIGFIHLRHCRERARRVS